MNTRILRALTPLHVGEGHAIGAIDLPLSRERHTRWPRVPGASLKGALRAHLTRRGADEAALRAAFGPPEPEDEPAAGALRFGDALLLALPLRSLKGTFVLATCPLALSRLQRLHPEAPALPRPGPDRALVTRRCPALLPATGVQVEGDEAGVLAMEELAWAARFDDEVEAWADWLGRSLDEPYALDRLVVLSDEVFTFAARAWTESRTRAAIDPQTGLVDGGKLFSTEALPAETLLFTTLGTRGEPLAEHLPLLPGPDEVFALGGHRTQGMGRVTWHPLEAAP